MRFKWHNFFFESECSLFTVWLLTGEQLAPVSADKSASSTQTTCDYSSCKEVFVEAPSPSSNHSPVGQERQFFFLAKSGRQAVADQYIQTVIQSIWQMFCTLTPFCFPSCRFLSRRSFCSGSTRVSLVWCICIVRHQQGSQQSRRSAAAAAAAAEHTYLKLQQLIVLTNSQPFLHSFFYFIYHAKWSQKATSFSISPMPKIEKKRKEKRRTINHTERHKLELFSLEVHYLRFPLTNSFVLHRQNDLEKAKSPNWEPVYAKQRHMHILWIIYFCINVQIIWRTKEKIKTRKALFTHTNTATDWQWCFILQGRDFILSFHCHYCHYFILFIVLFFII